MPDHFLCTLRSPDNTCAANAAEDLALCYLCHCQPVVNCSLHPFMHRNRADVPSFPDEVNNGPVVFAPLNVVKGQVNESSTVSQFPSLMPSFFAPFTRRMPAARSGLRSPVSAAS